MFQFSHRGSSNGQIMLRNGTGVSVIQVIIIQFRTILTLILEMVDMVVEYASFFACFEKKSTGDLYVLVIGFDKRTEKVSLGNFRDCQHVCAFPP